MKSTKYCMENLFLYDYKHVEEHLSAMAAKGWRLESIGARLWKYRRAEPGKVRYAVTYIQDASQFNPGPTERQQTLKELCAAAGWEKVCDWFQMQIYCSEAEDPVPLETEESVRLETVHRSMKRNYLPSNTVFLILSLAVSVWFVCTLAADPLRILENSAYLFIGPLLFLLSAILSITLGLYWRWYRRSSRSVAQGGPCASPDFDVNSINAIKVALMGPLSGVGDSFFQGTIKVIAFGLGVSLAQQGSILGPILAMLISFFPSAIITWFAGKLGYTMGSKYLSKLQGGLMDQVMFVCGIVGLMVVGGMAANMIGLVTPIQFESSGLVLQDILDTILPGMLNLAAALGLYTLIKKNISTTWLLVICIVGGIIFNALGVLA